MSAALTLSVNYVSNGPTFKTAVTTPPITCTEDDENWKIVLPEIVSEDKQKVTFIIPQIDELSKLFTISERTIVINPLYKQLVTEGKLCPQDNPV